MKMTVTQTALYLLASTVNLIGNVYSHGATSVPAARQWLCSGGPTPNRGVLWNGIRGAKICSPNVHKRNEINWVIVNWSGVNRPNAAAQSDKDTYKEDPRAGHIKAMNAGLDAHICTANRDKFKALDTPKWTRDQGDKLYPTRMTTGRQKFVYKASAPHRTGNFGYIDYYITKKDWNPNTPLTWKGLEEKPFCRFTQNAGEQFRQSHSFYCIIPEDKTGSHVIYSIWQRHDSDEAFYGCSDVILSDGVNEPKLPTGDYEYEDPVTQPPRKKPDKKKDKVNPKEPEEEYACSRYRTDRWLLYVSLFANGSFITLILVLFFLKRRRGTPERQLINNGSGASFTPKSKAGDEHYF